MAHLFLGVACVVAVLDWVAVAGERRRLGYVTKPGVMLALLAALGAAQRPAVTSWFAVGVAFSLLGDVFLMLPRERFLAGLAAFMCAHLAYITGFAPWLLPREPVAWALALLVGVVAVLMARSILAALAQKGKATLRVPVAVYMAVIVGMTIAAIWTNFQPAWDARAAVLVSLGAVYFLLSDALLAWNRFVHPVGWARLKVRVLYHVGQILLVLGVIVQAGG